MAPALVNVKSVDMRDDMQQEAITCALRVGTIMSIQKVADFAAAAVNVRYFCRLWSFMILKRTSQHSSRGISDSKFEPTWHCVVGKSFGAILYSEQSSCGCEKLF